MCFSFRRHPFAGRLPPEGKLALPVLAVAVRKTQEVKSLWLPFPTPLSISLGPSTELDQTRLLRI
jgi:hypothetical protein